MKGRRGKGEAFPRFPLHNKGSKEVVGRIERVTFSWGRCMLFFDAAFFLSV